MNIFSEPIILSVIGGVLYQVFPIIENLNNKDKEAPNQLNWNLLLIIPFYGFLGGLLCYLYFEEIGSVNKIIYFHIGLSSPLILRSLATIIPKI